MLCTFPEVGHSVFLSELRAISSRVESDGTHPLWVLRVLRPMRRLWGPNPAPPTGARYEGCSPRHAHTRDGSGSSSRLSAARAFSGRSLVPGVTQPHQATLEQQRPPPLHNRQLTGRVAKASPGQRSAVSDRTVTEGRDHAVGTTHGLQESCFPDDWLWTTPVRC